MSANDSPRKRQRFSKAHAGVLEISSLDLNSFSSVETRPGPQSSAGVSRAAPISSNPLRVDQDTGTGVHDGYEKLYEGDILDREAIIQGTGTAQSIVHASLIPGQQLPGTSPFSGVKTHHSNIEGSSRVMTANHPGNTLNKAGSSESFKLFREAWEQNAPPKKRRRSSSNHFKNPLAAQFQQPPSVQLFTSKCASDSRAQAITPSPRNRRSYRFFSTSHLLRNKVYDLATEKPIGNQEHKFSANIRLTRNYKHGGPVLYLASRRLFHGLTQVCRQLRAEFRPLYIERNEVCVGAEESAEYVKMMWTLALEDAPVRRLAANIAVDVRRGFEVDILPTLRFIGTRSTISARFIHLGDRRSSSSYSLAVNKDLKAMFTDDRSKWLGLYNEHITKITVKYPRRFPLVEISFKQGFLSQNVLEFCHGRRYKFIMVFLHMIDAAGSQSMDWSPIEWLDEGLDRDSVQPHRRSNRGDCYDFYDLFCSYKMRR
ncbi:hypothetical protein P171DRAFT_449356 [Karstenula rhodostoma CBS 690.94]|uniref:Uncharacterized protein n=1 Tax=Karstenula rhodostoma CBS 690.94 TaxID=1392251 RepID=A0A9P4P786_9PLEO|nr:hypothetical protein P171DRAFT_449356 [Karstenula rhodostoma CBS 690.94]